MMKHLPNLSNRWKAHAWGASLLAVSLWSTVPFTSPASAQTLLRINSDTSSFENLELIHGDVAVRASYRHYQELQESDDNNLSYQLLYQGEDQGAVVDTLAWIFAEFELQDLDSDGTIEVIVRNFSGGAHCCTSTTIHRWDGNGFAAIETGYMDGAGLQFEDFNDDGYAEVIIPNQAFLYRFGSYVESFPPMTIFTYRNGELVDTTHQYLDRIRDQAVTIRRLFLQVREENEHISNAMLASYVAQQAVLNEDFAAAWQFMVDNHNSEDPWGLEIYDDVEQVGVHPDFPTALQAFLIETGYLGENGQPIP